MLLGDSFETPHALRKIVWSSGGVHEAPVLRFINCKDHVISALMARLLF